MNHLKGTRCYLCGAISFLEKADWRDEMESWLKERGVIVLNPLKKRLLGFDEGLEERERRKTLKAEGKFEIIKEEMRKIRCVDLRMVDISDFLVVNIDNEIYTIGTWEEVALANREKKPILIRIKQGKKNCGDWVFGMIDHENVFDSFKEIKKYLENIDNNGIIDKRWYFFDF